MPAVDWMVFSTPFCKNTDRRGGFNPGRRRAVRALLGVGAAGWAGGALPALVDKASGVVVNLQRTAEGLWLSARWPMELPPHLEDALHKGVPLHFVWHAELQRKRWYWSDERVSQLSRRVRLVFQPLTRRWRLSVLSGTDLAAGSALHQSVDTLEEALAIVSRVSDWRVADASVLEPDEKYRLQLRFQLDAGLLPRLFQLGGLGASEGATSFQQWLAVPDTLSPVPQEP